MIGYANRQAAVNPENALTKSAPERTMQSVEYTLTIGAKAR
jgi:hypothetical protein